MIIKINGVEHDVDEKLAKDINAFVSSVNARITDREELYKIGDSFGIDTSKYNSAREAKIQILKSKNLDVDNNVSEEFLNGAIFALGNIKVGDEYTVSSNENDYDKAIEEIFGGAE